MWVGWFRMSNSPERANLCELKPLRGGNLCNIKCPKRSVRRSTTSSSRGARELIFFAKIFADFFDPENIFFVLRLRIFKKPAFFHWSQFYYRLLQIDLLSKFIIRAKNYNSYNLYHVTYIQMSKLKYMQTKIKIIGYTRLH